MKAIDTQYAGCLFRSRLEARWAVFFDALGEPWEYEKEGFELPSGRYLPDFWLPRLDCWLEIKGTWPTAREMELCVELAYATDKPVAIAWGLPFLAEPSDCDAKRCWRKCGARHHATDRMEVFCGTIRFSDKEETRRSYWLNDVCWLITEANSVLQISDQSRSFDTYLSPSLSRQIKCVGPGEFNFGFVEFDIDRAINAAKSARFEFGQTPAIRR